LLEKWYKLDVDAGFSSSCALLFAPDQSLFDDDADDGDDAARPSTMLRRRMGVAPPDRPSPPDRDVVVCESWAPASSEKKDGCVSNSSFGTTHSTLKIRTFGSFAKK
jgi:hypothetical protein